MKEQSDNSPIQNSIFELRTAYNSGEISPAQFVFFGNKLLKNYIAYIGSHLPKEELFDFGFFWSFDNALEECMSRQYKAMEDRYFRGLLIEALVRLGCSANQAYQAVGVWLSIKSDTTLKTAHKEFNTSKNLYEAQYGKAEVGFFERNWDEILGFIVDNSLVCFPDSYTKAKKAFKDLFDICLAEMAKDGWEFKDLFPEQIGIEKIRQSVIA